MKLIFTFLSLLSLIFYLSCGQKPAEFSTTSVIADGQMPNIARDKEGNLHLVYGAGDSIMYDKYDIDGKSFSDPSLVAVLPKLAASHMRGPQISTSSYGVTILACNSRGDIYSYLMDKTGKWMQTAKVNDRDTVAKEGLMAFSGDDQNLFAVWLDLRDKHNKIYGARSDNGGNSWTKNVMIYASPDSTVCECCKPCVVIKGNNVYVMFRNWLHGNRDLYLIQSTDLGNSFGQAEKLGNESWALDGCPMDGGAFVINGADRPQTVWFRKGDIFTCEPAKQEVHIGEGRACTIELVNNKNVYAWAEKGEIVCLMPGNQKRFLGKGQLPLLKSLDDDHLICIWENEKKIQSVILSL